MSLVSGKITSPKTGGFTISNLITAVSHTPVISSLTIIVTVFSPALKYVPVKFVLEIEIPSGSCPSATLIL